jgi:hypothetical protein
MNNAYGVEQIDIQIGGPRWVATLHARIGVGRSAFLIEAGEAKMLIDPFLSDNPSRDKGWSCDVTGENSTQRGDR